MFNKTLKFVPLLALLWMTSSSATVQIMTTRVVFNAAEKEQTVRINNVGKDPELVQVWLSSTDKSDGAVKESLPFFINPPAARINPQKGKVFRIFQTKEAVAKYPKDRETVLWLNVLDIPPDAVEDANQNQLKMAFRTLIKFFYRPAGLKGNPQEAADNLRWEIKKVAKGYDVIGVNASPWHVSMTNAWLTNGQGKEVVVEGQMVAPYSTMIYHFTQVETLSGKGIFKYNYITDLGAYVTKTQAF
ncbi:fimbrial biogenesis chaperone [unidentified bacterial endosymbiont]|jgi:chaperone protein EcpD|uniref:fimbrial biogenesis chaperone n=1 Tax=unidentified bacterial endosymbiont TaxID=2355 RepID=UPI00209E641E|nr:fimbria/pilus periplasmic chaperone [unidentified bacterial endosymbiont]